MLRRSQHAHSREIVRRLVPIALVLVAAACSGESADGTSSTTSTDAATATASTPAATPDPTADAAVIDGDADSIVAAYEVRSDAWLEGAAVALERGAAFAYPPGVWDPDSISLPCRKAVAEGGTEPTLEEWVRSLDQAGYRRTLIADESSIVADPDWTIPPGRPEAGTHPDGRVYAVEVTSRSTAPESDGTRSEHVTALNGTIYWFPGDC